MTTGWARWAEGNDRALFLRRDLWPFAAAEDRSPQAIAALGAIVREQGECWILEPYGFPTPGGTRVSRVAACVQMIADDASSDVPTLAFQRLGPADADEMATLVDLTRPGPFGPKAYEVADFIGVRREGRLIAMAGERMRIPPFAEVSAVCTHPDARGQGLAAGLMRAEMQRIRARGETPFLHAYTSNPGAIGLYERLGFRARRTLIATVLDRADDKI